VRRADLLLALNEHGQVDRRLSVPGFERGHVHRNPGLVIGRAAPEKPAIPLGRLERW